MLELLQRWAKLQTKVCRPMPSGTEFWCGNTLVCTQALGDAQRGAILMAVMGAIAAAKDPKLVWYGSCGSQRDGDGWVPAWAELRPLQNQNVTFIIKNAPTFEEALLLAWVEYLEGVG